MTFRRKLASESLTYAAAGAIGKAIALVTVPFLSRGLGPADYGLLDLATATAAIIATLVMFSGDIPAARLARMATTDAERRRVYGAYVVGVALLSMAVSAMLLPTSGAIAATVWSAPEAGNVATLSILLVPVSAIQAALATIQRLEGRPRMFAGLATVDLVAQVSLAVAFVALGMGAHGAVGGLLLGGLIGLVAAGVADRHLITIRVNAIPVLRLVALGLPFLPAFTAFVAADYIARALTAEALGQAAVGAFGVAVRLASVMALMSAAFQLAWGPRAMAMTAGDQTAGLFGRIFLTYAALAALACIAVSGVGPELVSLVSGEGFLAAAAALPGMSAAAVLAGSHYILSMGAGITGRGWAVAASSVAGAVTQVAVTAITIAPLGIAAVGLGAIAGRGLSVATLTMSVRGTFDHRVWPASAILIGMCALCATLGWLNLEPGTTLIRGLVATASGMAFIMIAAKSTVFRPAQERG